MSRPLSTAWSSTLCLLAASGAFAQSPAWSPATLSAFDDQGVPGNLLPVRETYSDAFLQDVVSALPEARNLTVTRPQLLENATERNLVLIEDAEVRISFVHEGAGYRNVVGVFEFPTGEPPATQAEVDHVCVFPNTSFKYSGGGLTMGDTVDLGELSAGTSLGFWLNANGFKTGPARVTGGNWTVYSIDALNPASDPALKRQTVLLSDPEEGRFVLAFEDITRNVGGDQDFNDVIITIEVTPYTAIQIEGVPDLEVAKDVDLDGVPNSQDDYPDDPTRAFRAEFPAQGQVGVLAFEDLWPQRGDFDFNDLVVSYHATQALDADGKVVDLEIEYGLLARGAAYHNGLLVRLPGIDPAAVARVTRRFDAFDPVEHALSDDQSQATALVFADAHLLQPSSPGTIFGNSIQGSEHVQGRSVAVTFEFATPLDPALLGDAPYDTFLKRGGVEVHLPGQLPSDTADLDLVQTGDDDTRLDGSKTYQTPWGQPWALLVPDQWEHPAEKTSVEVAYPEFVPWGVSAGAKHSDWYARPGEGGVWRAGLSD